MLCGDKYNELKEDCCDALLRAALVQNGVASMRGCILKSQAATEARKRLDESPRLPFRA
jgi:hypothetical protein